MRGEPHGQLLEPPEAARRLGELVEVASRARPGRRRPAAPMASRSFVSRLATESGAGRRVLDGDAGCPATIRVTRSAAAATRWLTRPRRSRKRPSDSVGGMHARARPRWRRDAGRRRARRGERRRGRRRAARIAASSSPREHQVGDPEREAVDDDQVMRGGQRVGRRRTRSSGSSTRGPAGRALGAVTRDARGHVARRAARRWRRRRRAARAAQPARRAKRLLPLRAPPRMRCDECTTVTRSSREDRREVAASGQVSWLSDRPTPRAFPAATPASGLRGFRPRLQ